MIHLVRDTYTINVEYFLSELFVDGGKFIFRFDSVLSILFNLLSAATCLIGLFIGTALGADEKVRVWLIAITAGMFIYVALVDMVSLTL